MNEGALVALDIVIPNKKLSVLLGESFSPVPHLGAFYWIVGKSKNAKNSLHGVC